MRGIASLFLFIFTLSYLEAANNNCRTAIERLGQIEIPASGLSLTNNLPPTNKMKKMKAQESSLINPEYWVEWTSKIVNINHNKAEARIDFLYYQKSGETFGISLIVREPLVPNRQIIQIKAGKKIILEELEERKPTYLLHLDLPRNSAGEFKDLDIVADVLSYISSKSITGDIYSFTLNDPGLIDVLNKKMDTLLTAIEYKADAPRRSGGTRNDPLFEYYPYDPFQESYFPSLSEADAKDIFRVLREELDLENELIKSLRETEFGKQIEKSGNWKIGIRIIGYTAQEILEKEKRMREKESPESAGFENGKFEINERNANPYIYVIQIDLIANP